jgi:hypothetical protein
VSAFSSRNHARENMRCARARQRASGAVFVCACVYSTTRARKKVTMWINFSLRRQKGGFWRVCGARARGKRKFRSARNLHELIFD